MSANKAKYLVLDTESTGLIPGKHGLIQLACISLDKNLQQLDSFCVDIKPPENTVIEPEALEINGFTLERINQGISYLQTAEKFLSFLNDNFDQEPIMVAQFYPADYAVLLELCKQTGQIGRQLHQKLGNSAIDTKTLTIVLNFLAESENKTLPFPVLSLSKPGGIKDVLNVKNYQAHDAMGDVLATKEVLIKLLTYFV